MTLNKSIITLTLLLIAGGVVCSQELGADEDPFNTEEFEASVAESIAGDKEQQVDILFGGSFLFSTGLLTDFNFNSYASGRLSGKPFVKVTDPRLGSLFLSYNLSSYIFQAANSTVYTASSGPYAAKDLFVIDYSLSEFFISFDFYKAVYIRAGNQISSWGPSFFWTPVDFVNLEKSTGFGSLDLRQGIPSVKIQVPFPSGTITAFFDFSDSTAAGTIDNFHLGTNAALRLDLVLGGFAWGLTGYVNGTPTELITKYGFDIAGNILGFDLYTEHAVTLSYTDTGTINTEFDRYSASVGFERVLGELSDWTLRSEFFFNSSGTADTQAALGASQFVPFYTGMFYAYAGIRKQNSFSDFIDTEISCLMNISDFSFTIRLTNSFSLANVLPLNISLVYSQGDIGDEFSLLSDKSIALNLELRFIF